MPLQIGKTPIVVPRQHQFNEHVNDHQVEFARNVAKRMGTIIEVEDIETLGDVITNYDRIVAGMLKLACDAFSKDYFSEHYRALEEADYTAMSREDYLKELERLDIEVGKKNNLGEIKSFVLLQVLSVMLGEQMPHILTRKQNDRVGNDHQRGCRKNAAVLSGHGAGGTLQLQ